MSLLGIDIGTTGCKTAVVGHGRILGQARREYTLHTPRPGWYELDPNEVLAAVEDAVCQATAATTEKPIAVAVSSLGEAVTAVNPDGRPVGRSILSFDRRSQAQFEDLIDCVGAAVLADVTTMKPLPHYSIFKWMWLAREQPEMYAAAKKLLCYGDLIAARMGLDPAIDYSMAARTLAFNPARGDWDTDILEAAGIDPAKLPAPVPSGTTIGSISDDVREAFGLAPGAVLVAGGLDQACAALGVGAHADGVGLFSLGTTTVLGAVSGGATNCIDIPHVPHVVPGERFGVLGSPAGGASLRWYRDVLGAAETTTAAEESTDVYDLIVEQAADRMTSVVTIPHFGGSRGAFDTQNSRASISGITLGTERADIVRSILEGVGFETKLIARRFQNAGLSFQSLRSAGGGSRSTIWMQILADVIGVPIESTATSYAAAYGAALIATRAADGEETTPLPVKATYMPDISTQAYYAGGLKRYIATERALVEV